MRWFKHMTDSRSDEKIAALIDQGGAEAYGLWWMVLETIARNMDKANQKCSVRYPISRWAAELQVAPQNVSRKLAVLVAAGLLQSSREGAMLELSVPNLLKYRDEYSARIGTRSGQSPAQEAEAEADVETEAETTTKHPQNSEGAAAPGSPSPNPIRTMPTPGYPTELGEMLEYLEPDPGALSRIWNACRNPDPKATPQEVAHCCRMKWAELGPNVQSRWGVLITQIPKHFSNGGSPLLRKFRHSLKPAAVEPISPEQQAFDAWCLKHGKTYANGAQMFALMEQFEAQNKPQPVATQAPVGRQA